jgi:CheY-like chemotaxis protein
MTAEVIVLVEDDPDDVFLTSHTLARSGLTQEIVVAGTGRAALELLLPTPPVNPVCPALLLLDLNLPDLSGREVLQRLRGDSRTAGLPVIVFVSTRSEEHEPAFRSASIVFARKPLTLTTFQRLGNDLGILPLESGEARLT